VKPFQSSEKCLEFRIVFFQSKRTLIPNCLLRLFSQAKEVHGLGNFIEGKFPRARDLRSDLSTNHPINQIIRNVEVPCGNDCFLTGISTPPNHYVYVISRRLCSGWLRPGSASAYVCSGLLTHLARHRQLLTRGLKGPPFPARDPKSVPPTLSQPVPARTHSQQLSPSARL
jgi:hypothetical protein